MALAVAIIGAIQLVWDWGSLAKHHNRMKRDFYALLSEFRRGADEEEIRAKMIALYGLEPPENERIGRMAHNRAGESLYGDDFTRV